jgi:hypothetical protein
MLVATPRIATPAPTPAGPRTAPRVNAPVSRGPAPTAAGRTPTHLGEAGASDTTIGNCIIQGDTSSMPLTSVFQFLTRVHKTGTLTIEFKGEHLVIEVAEGCVEFTTSDQPPEDETICQVLLELGHAHQKQVEALAGRVDDGWGNGLPAGLADDLPADDADDAADDDTAQAAEHKVLVELMRSGMVSDAQIQAVLQQIAKRRLRRIIRCKGATYAFHEGIRETARNRIRIRMPIRFSAGDQKSATPTRSQ